MSGVATWVLIVLVIGCGSAQPEPDIPETSDLDLAGSPFSSRPRLRSSAPVSSAPAPAASATAPTSVVTSRSVSVSLPRDPRFTGKPIDLDVKDADIHLVLGLIAEAGDVNIVIPDDVTGKVTLAVRNIPWDQVLDLVVRSQGLSFTQNGNVITMLAPAK